jgi:hypothetical protein
MQNLINIWLMGTQVKELNRGALLEKRYISEPEFVNTVSYEFWCYRNHPPALRDRAEKRILEEYLGFLGTGKLIIE